VQLGAPHSANWFNTYGVCEGQCIPEVEDREVVIYKVPEILRERFKVSASLYHFKLRCGRWCCAIQLILQREDVVWSGVFETIDAFCDFEDVIEHIPGFLFISFWGGKVFIPSREMHHDALLTGNRFFG
jgi:hypothetical protein